MHRCFGWLALAVCVISHHRVGAQEFDITPFNHGNSASAEYAPTYDVVTSSILFTSESTGTAALYRVRLGRPTSAELVGGTFNDPRRQRGCVSLDSSGNGIGVMYAAYDDQMYAGLTTVTRFGADVNLGTLLDAVNGQSYVSQPALSRDGSRVAFVSTRIGGRGGRDLWISERRDDMTWSEPMNAGSTINSDGDEITPFFVSNDTLMFASNGFGGRGGYDVMYSVLRDGVWHEPIPLDGINTEYDDSDCIVLPDGTIVFASTRPGGVGGLDLWIARRK